MAIDVEHSGRGILVVTINNPARRNALNLEVLEGLADALAAGGVRQGRPRQSC